MLEAIRGRGLELQVIFNTGAVIVLPAGINKASGLKAALREMNISVRKYAQGELPRDRSFHFRGPDGRLNLRAHNLFLFLDMAGIASAGSWGQGRESRRRLQTVAA